MNIKGKLIVLFIFLIILIFGLRFILSINSLSYKLVYDDKIFNIKEVYNNEKYYIEIKTSSSIFPFYIYKDLNSKRKVIDQIYYYNDYSYECILPIVNNEVITDMVCKKNNILYNYSDIIGEDDKLDNYVNSIMLYNKDNFIDNTSKIVNLGTVQIYENNSIDNILAITTYKGLIVSGKEIKLFNEDIYNNKISTFVDHYYLIADYENDYDFNYFYVVNLLNGEKKQIKSKENISLDSYIQGIVDNKVYLYDKDNEVQYEIDVIKNKINIVSSSSNIRYYTNKKWESMSKIKANKEIYFDYSTLDNIFTDYDYVYESDNYYYLLKKEGALYDLYRVDKKHIEYYKFIAKIPTNLIYYNNNYIYYSFDDKIYYYDDMSGLKTLALDTELKFNSTIKYYIY